MAKKNKDTKHFYLHVRWWLNRTAREYKFDCRTMEEASRLQIALYELWPFRNLSFTIYTFDESKMIYKPECHEDY